MEELVHKWWRPTCLMKEEMVETSTFCFIYFQNKSTRLNLNEELSFKSFQYLTRTKVYEKLQEKALFVPK